MDSRFQVWVREPPCSLQGASKDQQSGGVAAHGGLLEELHRNRKRAFAQSSEDDGASVASGSTITVPSGKKQKGEPKLCSIDGRPIKPGKRYCEIHNRCHDNVRRRAFRGIKRGDELTDQAIAFMQIFGDKKQKDKFPGDPAAADKCIVDYEAMFPDGDENSARSSGLSRGHIDLTQYSTRHGVEKSRTDFAARPKWDMELFLQTMQRKRGWLPARAKAKWDEMLADPSNWADDNGPDLANPKRLYIPCNLAGFEQEQTATKEFESKEVVTTSKAVKGMSEDKKEDLITATKSGFSRLAGVSNAQASEVATNSIGADPKVAVEGILMSAVGKTKSSGAMKGEKDKDGGAQEEEAYEEEDEAGLGSAEVAVKRNALARRVTGSEWSKREKAIRGFNDEASKALSEEKARKDMQEYKDLMGVLDITLALISQKREGEDPGGVLGQLDDTQEVWGARCKMWRPLRSQMGVAPQQYSSGLQTPDNSS